MLRLRDRLTHTRCTALLHPIEPLQLNSRRNNPPYPPFLIPYSHFGQLNPTFEPGCKTVPGAQLPEHDQPLLRACARYIEESCLLRLLLRQVSIRDEIRARPALVLPRAKDRPELRIVPVLAPAMALERRARVDHEDH